MDKLPKVEKGLRISKAERLSKATTKAIASAMMIAGITIGTAIPAPSDAKTAPTSSAVTPATVAAGKAILLKPASAIADQLAYHESHYSHSSHQSHYSHQSHHSHYSSRY